MRRPALPAFPLLAALSILALALVVGSICIGDTSTESLDLALRAVGSRLGLADEVEGPVGTILGLRLWDALAALGVGAALALSGGLIQGLFRNGLASPSLLGVTGGASLGAAIAILLLGGYGPGLVPISSGSPLSLALIPLFGFLGALCTVTLVTLFASRGGRISVPTLLLFGIALNMCVGGLFAAIQSLTLADDWEVSRAILAWTFGTLRDRDPEQVVLLWIGVALSASVIPFVATELDLFGGGEEDAAALGVDTTRAKVLTLLAAALSASTAVAVAGQIAFVGLVVPHLLRLVTNRDHVRLLPLCLAGGGVFLLGTEFLQRVVLGSAALQPGAVMSALGGPFFLVLLLRSRREVEGW